MTNNDNNTPLGPQGTQMFDLSDVNKMIAEEIISSQSENASTPALIGISPNVSGQKFILDKDKLEVGRRPNSDISLNVPSVSSMHAHIIQQEEQWKLLNLLSSNGTYINGEKITEQIINQGDRVSFADAEFVFALVDEKPILPKKSIKQKMDASNIFGLIVLILAFVGILYYTSLI